MRTALFIILVQTVSTPSMAGELETSIGGHVTSGLKLQEGAGAGTILSQVELDATAYTDSLSFRLDLDFHIDPYLFRAGANPDFTLAPHYPLPPEVAMVQLGRKVHLRAGVTNPDFGAQEWDEKDNALPSTSESWKITNGQNLGLEPGITFDDGTNLFAFAGYDLAWLTPCVGAGVQTEQETFGTWSGAYFMPDLGYGLLLTANDLYPTDWLWLTLEIDAGLANGDALGGGQLVAQVFPESVVGGALRVDRQWMSDDAAFVLETEMDAFVLTAGLRADPTGAVHMALDAKESWPRGGGDPNFTGTLLVAFQLPEETP